MRLQEARLPSPQRVAAIQAQRAEEIDTSDIPELPDDFWENGLLAWPEGKTALSIRIDQFVLDYFKRGGPGYQSRINAVLRSYVVYHLIEEAKAAERNVLAKSKS
jgi:uncharacterized protein (DUF4415 family)